MLFCTRAGRESAIIFKGDRSPQKLNISTNDTNKEGFLKK